MSVNLINNQTNTFEARPEETAHQDILSGNYNVPPDQIYNIKQADGTYGSIGSDKLTDALANQATFQSPNEIILNDKKEDIEGEYGGIGGAAITAAYKFGDAAGAGVPGILMDHLFPDAADTLNQISDLHPYIGTAAMIGGALTSPINEYAQLMGKGVSGAVAAKVGEGMAGKLATSVAGNAAEALGYAVPSMAVRMGLGDTQEAGEEFQRNLALGSVIGAIAAPVGLLAPKIGERLGILKNDMNEVYNQPDLKEAGVSLKDVEANVKSNGGPNMTSDEITQGVTAANEVANKIITAMKADGTPLTEFNDKVLEGKNATGELQSQNYANVTKTLDEVGLNNPEAAQMINDVHNDNLTQGNKFFQDKIDPLEARGSKMTPYDQDIVAELQKLQDGFNSTDGELEDLFKLKKQVGPDAYDQWVGAGEDKGVIQARQQVYGMLNGVIKGTEEQPGALDKLASFIPELKGLAQDIPTNDIHYQNLLNIEGLSKIAGEVKNNTFNPSSMFDKMFKFAYSLANPKVAAAAFLGKIAMKMGGEAVLGKLKSAVDENRENINKGFDAVIDRMSGKNTSLPDAFNEYKAPSYYLINQIMGKPENLANRDEAHQEFAKHIQGMATNAEALSNTIVQHTSPIHVMMPTASATAGMGIVRNINNINSKLPVSQKRVVNPLMEKDPPASDTDKTKLEDYTMGMTKPLSIAYHAYHGTLNQDMVDGFRDGNPIMFGQSATKVIDKLTDSPNISYQNKLILANFFKMPTDDSMDPMFISKLQQLKMTPPQSPATGLATNAGLGFPSGGNGVNNQGSLFQTPNQRSSNNV